jgi:DNA-binding MarR family transcriptional regulator
VIYRDIAFALQLPTCSNCRTIFRSCRPSRPDQTQKILDEENITIAHWIYLRVLAERGELNQLELSKRVGMASTTAVPALDSMEKRGLLKRRRDPKDRRKYYVVLTEKGGVWSTSCCRKSAT